jgi:selenide, water dikinase
MFVTGTAFTDIVLLGAGHAHVEVLRRFAQQPDPQIRLTLVAREPSALYSGMLAGVIRGDYTLDQASIDLAPLAAAAGARLMIGDATALRLREHSVAIDGRPDLPFDLLSLNLGGVPRKSTGEGIPAKPIGRFIEELSRMEAGLSQGSSIAIVGAGPGGVELALALAHRYRGQLHLTLIIGGAEPLADAPGYARKVARNTLMEAGVSLVSGVTATHHLDGRLFLSDGSFLEVSASIWATDATGPSMLAEAGLNCDPLGCVHVDAGLRSLSHDFVFAAGDCATLAETPRPKGSVWSARAGAPLAENLRRTATGKPMMRWQPQEQSLTVLGLGGERAVAWRSGFAASGRNVWRYKDWADRKWIDTYASIRPSDGTGTRAASGGRLTAPRRSQWAAPSSVAIGEASQSVALGPSLTDFDPSEPGTVVKPPLGKLLVQTIEQVAAPIDDPFVLGRIAAVHTLGDLHAAAARPSSALALISLPLGNRVDLAALLQGIDSGLQPDGATLIRWDAREGSELTVSLSASGWGDAGRMRRHPTLRPDDVLILTKPLGSTSVLAGSRQGLVRASWLQAALASMQQSDDTAGRILTAHLARGCTTLKTRGLIGDLTAMLDACGMAAVLLPREIPLLPGVMELSTRREAADPAVEMPARPSVLEEPQLAGGLLAAVPPDRAASCLAALSAAGISGALIGRVEEADPAAELIRWEPV